MLQKTFSGEPNCFRSRADKRAKSPRVRHNASQGECGMQSPRASSLRDS